MGIPDHHTCLLRNMYTGQATVRTGQGTTDWFLIGKGVCQGCILSLCLFNLCAEYIMRNAGMDEAQAEIKIGGRNSNNLRYTDDTTIMAEWRGTKELLDESERGEWKIWLKTQHSKNEYHGIRSHNFMTNRWGNNGNSDRLYSEGLQNHCRWWLKPWNSKTLAPWKKSYDQPRQHIKKQRHYFSNKSPSSQSDGFSRVMCGCESWTIKKAEHWRIDAFFFLIDAFEL